MRTAGPGRESFSSVHSSAGSDVVVNDSPSTGRHHRLSAIAWFGAAGGRLPHDPGADFFPRSDSGCHGLRCYRAAREAVRSGTGPKPDDLDELGRKLGHHVTVLA